MKNENNENNENNEIIDINNNKFSKLESKYKMLIQIGAGSFGTVWRILHNRTHKEYAVKIEEKNDKSRLKYEFKIYTNLKKNNINKGIPYIKEYFETSTHCFLIMQLLGKNLDQLLIEMQKPFEINFVFKLGIKIIELLESLHNVGYLHRDIKPNNFLFDINNNELYIMDFGLSKKYIIDNGEHIKLREQRALIGTARYASINVHMGFEPSRRDDLESVGYMLIYFLKKKLPWQNLKEDKNIKKVQLIGECKMKTSINDLCENIPPCFKEYIKYCRNLRFDEIPDYNYLKNILSF